MANIPIGVHPYCVFDKMTDSELDQLAADIKKRGLVLDIWTYDVLPDGTKAKGELVLDGKNRWDACKRANVRPRFQRYLGTDPAGFVLAMDLRRHSTPEKRKEAIKALLKANPNQSDRKVASQTGTSKDTVGDERKKLEENGEIEPAPTRQASDGVNQTKGRGSVPPGTPGDDDDTNDGMAKPKSHKAQGKIRPTCKGDPLNDNLGSEVPMNLRDLFGDKWLGELIALINEVTLKIQKGSLRTKLSGKAQAYMAYLRPVDALQYLDVAIENLDLLSETLIAGLPHCVCQQCKGKGCDWCRKSGWMPQWRFDELEKTI